ncbi:uncharacterized protein LOC142242991 [Haematobia irritans]|uniref:uncharacterized protein LOC142242991 n=1 Tax=Haematobia irritans TaxID=7368 RepID=UPI003F4FFAF8
MERRQYKKKTYWAGDAEACLLHVWRENSEKLRGARKNSHIFEEMAQQMNQFGHHFSKEEVKIKIHNWSNKYRLEKKTVGPSGGAPSNWKLYADVHAIIGTQPSNNAEKFMEDNIDSQDSSFQELFEESDMDILEGYEPLVESTLTIGSPIPNTSKRVRTLSSSSESSETKECPVKKKRITYKDIFEVMKTTETLLKQECKERKKMDVELLKIQKEQLQLEREKNEIERERNEILRNMGP